MRNISTHSFLPWALDAVTNDQLKPPSPRSLLRFRPVSTEQEVWLLWGSCCLYREFLERPAHSLLRATLVWRLALAELVQAIPARSLYFEAHRKQPAVCLVINPTAAAASPVCDVLRLSTSIIPLKTDVYLYHGFANCGTCTTAGAATIVNWYAVLIKNNRNMKNGKS